MSIALTNSYRRRLLALEGRVASMARGAWPSSQSCHFSRFLATLRFHTERAIALRAVARQPYLGNL
jgi:hypothetical protein